MLLQSLVKYYESLAKKGEIERLGWNPVKISYGISLDENGVIEDVISLKSKTPDGKKEIPSNISLPMPVKRSSGVASNFLYENVTYLFGYDSSGKPDRAKKSFEFCKNKHLSVLKNCNDKISNSIKAFFENRIDNIEQKLSDVNCTPKMIDEILNKGVNLLLMPFGRFPTDADEICKAWDENYHTSESEKGICLVTGKYDNIAVLHPSIKNVRGAQSSGASLVSYNATAFESFGKSQGYNASVGEYAAFAYSSALNKLLADNEHRIFIGDTTVVCWTEDAESVYPEITYNLFSNDNTVSQKLLWDVITNVANGQTVLWENVPVNTNNNFYILGISPNAARLSVRFFIKNTFGNIMKNILLHEERMKIIKPSFENRDKLTLWQTVNQTVNPKSKDKACKPQLAGDVLDAILNNRNYPDTLYYGVQSRISAERNINWGKAAIIKAYLLKNSHNIIPKEEITVELNETCENKAYLLGVLFSKLEEVQNVANPGIKATIRDRYFVSASSTPALVFPLLIELAQNHIKKLERMGSGDKYQKKIRKTMSKLGTEFPVRLTLQEKGMFQLGYYHQTQERYKSKEEKNNG